MVTKVYYNSACPVCDAGIRCQRVKLDAYGAQVEWIDVHAENRAVAEIGADLEFVRERLHVVDAQGELHVGADAITELMAATPRRHWAARLVRLPVVQQVARLAYNAFAAVLYRWNRWRSHW